MSIITWYVYILFSDKANRFYIGITNNLEKRLSAHNKGKGARATIISDDWRYVYTEHCYDRSSASKREYQLKKMNRKQKESMVWKN